MSKKEKTKVSLSTVICIIIILLLIMALGGMYVYYNYIPKENISNTTNNETTNNTKMSLEIDSDLVEELYNYILKFNYYDEILVYQDNKITNDNIDNQLKLLTAFENLDESQAEKVLATEYTGVVEEDGNSYKYLYTKETVEEKVKEIFGENATVVHENCSPYDGYSRIYEDGIYTCYEYAGGGGVLWEQSEHQLLKAEQEGDNIYLYDSYVHLVEVSVNDIYNGTYDIYATSDRKILIDENVNLEENGIYEGTENLSDDDYHETYMNNLFNIIGNKQKTFKHTFTKDSDGNYYWVSTEIAD